MHIDTIEYMNPKIDRSKWPAGEWDGEPDKKQWQDADTGLPCLAVRHPSLGHWCGYVGVDKKHSAYGLDYDGCTKKKAAYKNKVARRNMKLAYKLQNELGLSYLDAMEKASKRSGRYLYGAPKSKIAQSLYDISVHGGLTYANKCQEVASECEGICHRAPKGEGNIWWFGFDCAHCYDFSPEDKARQAGPGWRGHAFAVSADQSYKTLDYVKQECASLAQQLYQAKYIQK